MVGLDHLLMKQDRLYKMPEVIIKAGDTEKLYAVARRVEQLDTKKAWVVSVEEYRPKRSLDQNALYHKWVEIIRQELGYEHDEMHQALMLELLPASGRKTYRDVNGEQRESRSSTKLNTKEFGEYLDAIERWAVQYVNIVLPKPQTHPPLTDGQQMKYLCEIDMATTVEELQQLEDKCRDGHHAMPEGGRKTTIQNKLDIKYEELGGK